MTAVEENIKANDESLIECEYQAIGVCINHENTIGLCVKMDNKNLIFAMDTKIARGLLNSLEDLLLKQEFSKKKNEEPEIKVLN